MSDNITKQYVGPRCSKCNRETMEPDAQGRCLRCRAEQAEREAATLRAQVARCNAPCVAGDELMCSWATGVHHHLCLLTPDHVEPHMWVCTVDALRAHVQQMTTALRPFSLPEHSVEPGLGDDLDATFTVTIGDVRRARRALYDATPPFASPAPAAPALEMVAIPREVAEAWTAACRAAAEMLINNPAGMAQAMHSIERTRAQLLSAVVTALATPAPPDGTAP